MAWEKQPQRVLSEIDESAVLGDLYGRYLKGKPYAEALARLATLGQFEIPADRVFFADPDALEHDLLVERLESRWGDPQLRLYHATPARYLALAHIHHIRGRRHFNAWTLDMLSDYLLSRPSNFFEVFYQLYRNELRDLQYHLFADLPLEELFQAHLDNAGQVDELDIVGAAGFIQGVWQWGKATANTLAPRLVERVDRWLARQDYAALRQLNLREVGWLLSLKFALATTRRWLAHLDYPRLGECSRDVGLVTVRSFLQLATQAGVEKAVLRAFAEGLDFKALGERSRDAGLATVMNFLRLAMQVGVDRAALRAFAEGLDFKALGERSREVGLATVNRFLRLATQVGVEKAALRAFAEGLDFKALGERSREVGLATVMTFLQKAKQAGVDKAKLRAFVKGLDFKALGEQSQDAGFASIEVFLRKVYQIGIGSEKLRLFCAQLNWHTLGQSVMAEPDKLRNTLFVFDPLFRQRSISPDMALQFIEGVGWSTLRQWMQDVFSVDVLAACRDVLKVKCGFELQTLRWRGVDFVDPELWRRSLFRPVGEVRERQKQLQARYFKDALRLLKQDGADSLLLRARTLRDLSILIHNLKQISTTWLAQEVEPRLRNWDAAKWHSLFDQADVYNLSIFLCRFSPRDGLFQWPLPAELRFSLDGKIRQATLLELAHLLFNFFFIQRQEQSQALALRLEAESGYIQEQLVASTLAEIEFFFWNYWLALPPEHEARLFRLPGLPDSLLPKLGAKLEYETHWLGLAGSWRMAAAPGLDTIQRDLRPTEALRICQKLAEQKSPVLIRSLIGLSLVWPVLADADRWLFAEALESTVLPGLNIAAQEQALAYLEDWLETT